MLLSTWDLVRPIAFSLSSTYLCYGIGKGYITAFVVACAEVLQRTGFRQVLLALLELGSGDRAVLEGTVLAKNRPACSLGRDLREPGSGAVFPLALDDGTHGVRI